MDFNQLERELEKRGKELLRTLVQEQLENRRSGKTSEPVKRADDVDRPCIFSHDRQIETIFGRVELNREGYGQEGCDSLHPLDSKFNIPSELYFVRN